MIQWKKLEKEMLSVITSSIESLSDLKQCKEKYARYDAYNSNYIVELKYRGTKHADALIEFAKYEALKGYSTGRIAIYAVEAEDIIYLFNLNRLHRDGWDYRWEMQKQPKYSKLKKRGNGELVNKKVGFIDWEEADITINKLTKEVRRRE